MSETTIKVLLITGFVWWLGVVLASLGYYYRYRGLEPTVGRMVAVLLWPVGIPVDCLYRRSLRK